jgi:hypothetical protein
LTAIIKKTFFQGFSFDDGSAMTPMSFEHANPTGFQQVSKYCEPFKAGLRIWIRIGSGFSDFVDPDPYWESGSRGKKMSTNYFLHKKF